jgi:ABC-2 type transport system permease protein
MKGFYRVFFREIIRIFTGKDLLVLCFAAPLLYGIVLTSVYSQKRIDSVPVGVVDLDRTALSRRAVRLYSSAQNIDITGYYASPEEALDGIIAGKTQGFLVFPRGFASNIKKGETATIGAAVNSANIIAANPVLQAVSEVSGAVSSGLFISNAQRKGLPREKALAVNQPVTVETRVLFNKDLNYSDFMIPGLIFAVIQQIILVGIGFSMAQEHQAGNLRELHSISDNNFLALLCGKTAPYIVINFLISMGFMIFLLPHFGIERECGLAPLGLYVLVFITAVSFLGVLLSAFFDSTITALIVIMFYSMPTFLISGYSWPYASMPLWVKAVGLVFPSTFFFDNLRMLISSGMPLKYLSGSITILLSLGLVYSLAAYFVIRKRL